jgi:hypothetical protein
MSFPRTRESRRRDFRDSEARSRRTSTLNPIKIHGLAFAGATPIEPRYFPMSGSPASSQAIIPPSSS